MIKLKKKSAPPSEPNAIPLAGITSIHKLAKPPLAGQDRLKGKKPTRENPLIISASELRDFLRCRVMHNWRHQMRLQPEGGSENLSIGILVHNIMEQYYLLPFAKRQPKAMIGIATSVVTGTLPSQLSVEDLEMIKAMAVGYASWAKEADAEIGLRECKPEQWFAEPLTKDKSIIVRGKIDLEFEPHKIYTNTIACNEYKTAKKIDVDHVDLNIQLTIYLWALRRKYPKKYKRWIARYTILRKQMPGPRVTSPLFHQETIERDEEQIAQWEEDTRRVAMDMADAAIYPNPMKSCSWDCDFKMPCLVRGDKEDLKHVLSTQFKVKEKHK